MHRQLAAQFMAALRGLDGINVANEVGNGHVGSGELFDVTVIGRQVGNARRLGIGRQQLPAPGAKRSVRVVMNLAAREVGNLWIKQGRQRAQNAALRLSAQTEQNEIVARQNGVNQLRDNRVFVPHDAGEHRLIAA